MTNPVEIVRGRSARQLDIAVRKLEETAGRPIRTIGSIAPEDYHNLLERLDRIEERIDSIMESSKLGKKRKYEKRG